MTAKMFLSQARWLDKRIDVKQEQVDRLRALATRITPTRGDVQVAGSGTVRSMEDLVAKIHKLEAEINAAIDMIINMKVKIAAVIAEVEEPLHRDVLEWRYLAGMSWENVAQQMNYSQRQVYTLHGRALLAVEKECSKMQFNL